MKNVNEIISILEDIKSYLVEKFKISEIGIFGSYVKNLNNAESDVDVLVDFSEPISFFKFLELEEYLENILQVKVDLVSKKALKPYIGKHILQEISYI
jgi:predicted nucleotidyltransferase